jgi:hypothetical protein
MDRYLGVSFLIRKHLGQLHLINPITQTFLAKSDGVGHPGYFILPILGNKLRSESAMLKTNWIQIRTILRVRIRNGSR